jgi:hypothetical protein
MAADRCQQDHASQELKVPFIQQMAPAEWGADKKHIFNLRLDAYPRLNFIQWHRREVFNPPRRDTKGFPPGVA